MSGQYLYCQNPECGVYLGSLGGDDCSICGWQAGSSDDDQPWNLPASEKPTQHPAGQAQGGEHD